MGTVRREGDWRLEKRHEGIYEITYRKEPQLKVLTPDRSDGQRQQLGFDAIPVREVSSFSEAEGLFEERAHGPAPFGMEEPAFGESSDTLPDIRDDFGESVDLSETPPGIFGFALLLVGSFMLYTFWGDGNQFALLIGVGFAGIGLALLGYGAILIKSEGWREGWEFLVSAPAESTSSGSSKANDSEKVPPASQQLKDELYFERANRRCEYCGEEIDHFEVHHITPRSDGGQNDPDNLIVLCPNCHSKADRGSISKSRLRYQLSK